MAASAYFTPDTFKFLRDLKRNNTREWFERNKPRYLAALREPCLRLIADLAAPLQTISASYVADPKPVGGSLFRIYRDTRFSGDKTPYKTHAGMQFYHARTRATARGAAEGEARGRLDAPVFYLHLAPGECFAGGGLWHPQPDTVKRVRDYMVSNPASWKSVTRSATFRKHFELGGEALVRPPRGYDPEHELIEDLKRKDFVASCAIADEEMLSPQLPRLLIQRYKTAAPMIDWLCGALELEF